MLRYVEETRDETTDHHIDIPGMLAVTGGLACISLVFDRGEAWGRTSVPTVGTLAGGVLLLALFVVIEGRVRSPLVSLSLFRNRAFDAVVIAGSLSNVVFCLVAVFSAFYLQQARGMSSFKSGLASLALSAGAGGAELLFGKARREILRGSHDGARDAVSTVGIVRLTTVTSLWLYTPLFFMPGVGLGFAWALTQEATQAVVPAEHAGAASGITLTSLVMLGAVGVAITAAMCELIAGSPEAAASDAHAIDVILLAAAVLAFVGAAGLMMFGRPPATPVGQLSRSPVDS